MRELSKEEVLNFWKKTKRKTNVYMHSAFCKEQCTYCTYRGTLFEKSAFKRYYSEYIPNQIRFYDDVLSSDIIHSYFFGGGTPSLMTPEIMVSIFNCIPNFKKCRKKLMEFHLCDWSEEKLNTIKEYSFNTVVACVQTFDSDILKKQKRRVPKTPEKIYDFIKYANSLGLHTMSDLIFFDTGDIDKDIGRLSTDIQKLVDNDITEITIQTNYDELGKHDVPVVKLVNEFIKNNSQYTLHPVGYSNNKGYKIGKSLRIYKNGIDWDEMYWQNNCMDGMINLPHRYSFSNYNTLGIGSYKNHKHTFSKIEDKLEYIEDGDTYTPKWLLTYDKKEWSTKKMIIDFYDKLENNIGDPPDGITFSFNTVVINYNEDKRNKKVQRELMTNIKCDGHSIIIDNYLKKLKKLFPYWKWS